MQVHPNPPAGDHLRLNSYVLYLQEWNRIVDDNAIARERIRYLSSPAGLAAMSPSLKLKLVTWLTGTYAKKRRSWLCRPLPVPANRAQIYGELDTLLDYLGYVPPALPRHPARQVAQIALQPVQRRADRVQVFVDGDAFNARLHRAAERSDSFYRSESDSIDKIQPFRRRFSSSTHSTPVRSLVDGVVSLHEGVANDVLFRAVQSLLPGHVDVEQEEAAADQRTTLQAALSKRRWHDVDQLVKSVDNHEFCHCCPTFWSEWRNMPESTTRLFVRRIFCHSDDGAELDTRYSWFCENAPHVSQDRQVRLTSFKNALVSNDHLLMRLHLLRGDIDIAKQIRWPNLFNGDAVSPIVAAANLGHAWVIWQLMLAGADSNQIDDLPSMNAQTTPLAEAAIENRVNLVDQLIDSDADVNLLNGMAIRVAARYNSVAALGQLIAARANVNAVCSVTKQTALHLAATHGNTESVAKLLAVANPNLPDAEGHSPLDLAIANKNWSIALLLIPEVSVHTLNRANAVLFKVIQDRSINEEVLKVLIRRLFGKADTMPEELQILCLYVINTMAKMPLTPKKRIHRFLKAVRANDANLVKLYVMTGDIYLEQRYRWKKTYYEDEGVCPLYFAAHYGLDDAAQALVEMGANVNQLSDGSNLLVTAPMQALLRGHKDIFRMLLPKLSNDLKLKALHFACFHGHLDLVANLLAEGASIEGPTRQYQETMGGYTPLMTAIIADQRDVVRELLQRGANPDALMAQDCLQLDPSGASKSELRLVRTDMTLDAQPVHRVDRSMDRTWSALDLAIRLSNWEIAAELIPIVDVKTLANALDLFNGVSIPSLNEVPPPIIGALHKRALEMANVKQWTDLKARLRHVKS